MNIPVNPGNFQGLGALAGSRVGYLGLPVPGSAGREQQRINLAKQQSLFNSGQALLNREQADKALLQQQANADRNFGLAERQVALQEQKAQQDMAMEREKMNMVKLLKEKEEKINDMGAFATSSRIMMENVTDPNDAVAAKEEIISNAIEKGYVTKEEAKGLKQMPISRFKSALDFKILQLNKVAEYHKMSPKKEDAKGSGTEVVLPDGTVVRSSTSEATAPTKNQLQKDIVGAEDNIRQLNKSLQVPDSYFGAQALKQKMTFGREWAESIPGVGHLIGPSESDKKELANFADFKANTELMSMNIIKQLSGVQYSDKQLEFLKQILPDIGPGATRSQFEGRSKFLMRFFNDIKQSREELLNDNFKLGSPAYKEQMLQKMQQAATPSVEGVDPALLDQARKQYPNASDADILRALKNNGYIK